MSELMKNDSQAIIISEPRDIEKVRKAVLREAEMFGLYDYESAVYSWKAGGKTIKGVGYHLAMAIARCYGVCDIGQRLIEETKTHFIFEGAFFDRETGFRNLRPFRQRKGQKISSKMDVDRQEDIVFQIGCSKAARNAILTALPKWLVKDAENQVEKSAQSAITKKIQEGKITPEKMIERFKKYSVEKNDLERRFGKVKDWSPKDYFEMLSIGNALKEEETSVENEFPPEPEKKSTIEDFKAGKVEEPEAEEEPKPETASVTNWKHRIKKEIQDCTTVANDAKVLKTALPEITKDELDALDTNAFVALYKKHLFGEVE